MKKILLTLLLLIPVYALAVTQKEMEQARTITAKQYLRYANNGSDYLDKLEVSTMQDLESKLKTKEKENITAFKKIATPADYSSWDKQKLVEYWSKTFFKSPELTEKGKEARTSVAKKLNALKISEPTQETEKQEAETSPEAEPGNETLPPDTAMLERLQRAEDSVKALAENMPEDEQQNNRSDGGTIIYIIILAVLIAIVIGLVVYASKIFRQHTPDNVHTDHQPTDPAHGNPEHLRAIESLSDTLAERESKLRRLERQLQQTTAALKTAERDNEILRNENRQLLSKLENTEKAGNTPATRRPMPPRIHTEIYMAHADNSGIFTRADNKPIPDLSIYKLDTADGITGTFDIIDDADVIETILQNPRKALNKAAKADIPQNIDSVNGITTLSPGTAIFENGYWKIVRQAKLQFV